MIYYKKKNFFKKTLNKIKQIQFADINVGFIKYLFVFFVISITCVYLLFLFGLPKIVTADKVEDLIKQNSKLNIDITNLQIIPNYKLNLGLKADNIDIFYDNKEKFINLQNASIEVNLVNLFFKYLDLDKIKAKKITVNSAFTKDKKYRYVDFEVNQKKTDFKLRNIKILCDEFLFNLYDENKKTNYYIKSVDNQVSLKELNKPVIVKSKGYIEGNQRKISDFSLNLEFNLTEQIIKEIKNLIENTDYNPFYEVNKYKFYTKSDINLKVLSDSNINGYINLSDLNFVFNNLQIPKNSINLSFKKDKISADCNFRFIKDEFVNLKLNAIHSKNKFIELKLNSNTLNLANLKNIILPLSDMLNLKFDFNTIDLTGSASFDVYLKSNFKTLISKGSAKITNAKLKDKTTGLTLDNINSNIDFKDNKINILNTSANVGQSKFHLYGNIDEKTNTDIKVYSDTINIAQIISLVQSLPLTSKMIPNLDDYVFKNGLINIKADIKGNLNKPVIITNSTLKDFKMFIKSLKSNVSVQNVLISTNAQNKINVTAKNNTINIENYKIQVNEAIAHIIDNKIILDKTKGTIDKIGFELKAEVQNFIKNPVTTVDIQALIPSKNNIFIIKNKNPLLKLSAIIDTNKVQIKDLKLLENNNPIANIEGNILNYSKKPKFDNIKVNIKDKLSIMLPNYNLSFDVKGNAAISGISEKPDITARLNLYNLIYKDLGLNIKTVDLDIKNSNVYAYIAQGQILGSNFDFSSEIDYKPDKIVAKYVSVTSDYIDIKNFEKCLNKIPNNIAFEIQELKGRIGILKALDIDINNVDFEGNLKNNILSLDKINANLYDGTVNCKLETNIKTLESKSEIVLKDANVRKLSNSLKEFSVAASGKLSSFCRVEFKGLSYDNILKTIKGYVKFDIERGELAQFAKLERYLQAGNILSQSILKLNINSIVSSVSKQNTGEFKTIEGTVKLNSPKAEIQYINTIGTNMSTRSEGTCDIVKQTANIKVFGQIPLSTVNVMGNIGSFSPKKLVDKITNNNTKEVIQTVTVSPIEKMMSTYITKEEYEKIPPLTYNCETRKFIVYINGPISSASSVKLFKWVIEE